MSVLPEAKSYDVVVVGMGPAGATAAYELSRAGLSVLGLEKHSHPRYKVCGGGLSVRIDRILDSDYKSVVEQTIDGVQFTYAGKEPLLIRSSNPIAYMVMRDRFDQFLVEKARRAGTELRQCERAEDFSQSNDSVDVVTDRGRYRTKVLIGADGANSVVAQRLFSTRRLRRMPTLESEMGLGSAPVYPAHGNVLIDLGVTRKGYAWIFPKKERLSIGLAGFHGRMANPKDLFHRFVKNETGLSIMNVPPPLGHPLPLYSSRDGQAHGLVNKRALLVGDAGHLVDPLFGEGIYYAVRSGQMAATSILGHLRDGRASLSDYEHAVTQEIYAEFRVASRMARIVYTFPRLCHRLLDRYQEVIHLYFDVLQGRETYQTFLVKAKGLVKTSFREILHEAIPFS